MATRKRRTREHVVEDLSENHLERLVLNAGHLLRRPRRDYGVDVTMRIDQQVDRAFQTNVIGRN